MVSIRQCLRTVLIVPLALFFAADTKKRAGGQAIIEGVMMRYRDMVSWAVRRNDTDITIERYPFLSASKKHKILGIPVFRGAVHLFESLQLGIRALNRSVEILETNETQSQEKEKKPIRAKIMQVSTILFSLLLSIGLFLYAPMWIMTTLGLEKSAFMFNLGAGALRIALFLGYLFFIRSFRDIRRVFAYHGAEHKVIFAFEADRNLTVEEVQPFSTHHPRCGTSFLLIVALLCILLFAVIDTFFFMVFGPYPTVLHRLVVHLALIPLVSGVSYEVLRFAGEHHRIFPVNLFVYPGLLLQSLTTCEPDDQQINVAIEALNAAQ